MSLIAPMGENHRSNFQTEFIFYKRVDRIIIMESNVCYNVYRLLL